MKTKTILLMLLLATVQGYAQNTGLLATIQTVGSGINDRAASFPSLEDYLSEHLIYPELARANGIEGNVAVEIVVSSSGNILKATILKGLGFGCDQAVLKMLNEMPAWAPAFKNGRPATQKINLNLRFKLASV